MSDVIDLDAERNKREQPDPKFVSDDQWGRPMYKFSASYECAGMTGTGRWSFHFWAYDAEDAERRLAAIKENGVIDGQIFAVIDG